MDMFNVDFNIFDKELVIWSVYFWILLDDEIRCWSMQVYLKKWNKCLPQISEFCKIKLIINKFIISYGKSL